MEKQTPKKARAHVPSQAPQGEKPDFSRLEKAALAAAGLLTLVGVSSAVASRMLRNELVLTLAFLGALVIAVALAVFLENRRRWWVIVLLFVVGVVGIAWLAGTTSQAKERPLIFSSFETTSSGLVKVTTTVKADGLTTEDLIYLLSRGRLRVAVNPVTGELLEEGFDEPLSVIEEASFGPNAAGSVEATLAFEVSPALFQDVIIIASRQRRVVAQQRDECIPTLGQIELTPDYSCVRFILPRGPIRPVLVVSISPVSEFAPETLTVNVSASGLPPSRVINVAVWVGSATPLVNQAVGPDTAGRVKGTISIPLPSGSSEVCVVAALVQPNTDSWQAIGRGLCDHGAELPENVAVAFVRGS